MRNILVIVIVVVLFSISSASAQFLGQLTPAPTLNKGDALLGGYLGVYEDAFSVFGQARYGLAKYVDFGFKMGLVDLDPKNSVGLVVGGDVKYWFMEERTGDPLDISVAGATEYWKVSKQEVFLLGCNIIGSYQIDYGQNKSVTPYGRFNVRWERTDSEKSENSKEGKGKNGSDDDLGVAVSLGADFRFSSNLNLIGELVIDDYVGLVLGINYFIF
ncbi:MAG: hypothetical protein KAX39_02585 [candidate division Zixibacteria bacterium]|nr:hypothetical protein [candidate division Zixibacteria bacterium]